MRLNLPPVPPPSIPAPSLPFFSQRSPYRPFLYRSEATGGGYGARRAIPPAPPAAPRRIRYFLGSATGVARRSDPFLSRLRSLSARARSGSYLRSPILPTISRLFGPGHLALVVGIALRCINNPFNQAEIQNCFDTPPRIIPDVSD